MLGLRWQQFCILSCQRRRFFISVPFLLCFVFVAAILLTTRTRLPVILVRGLHGILVISKNHEEPPKIAVHKPNVTNRTTFQKPLIFTPHFPHCLVIGVCKAGTRAILEFLNMHPDIVRPMFEVHFFDKITNYRKGYRWYLQQMPNSLPNQITVEKTAMYYAVPEVPQRVHQMNSSIKLLFVVRDPISRTVSDYLHMHTVYTLRKMKYKTFEEMAINPATGHLNLDFYAIQRSLYYHYLWRWLEYFPLSQIHIVDGDKLKTHPWEVMSGIEKFLGVRKFYDKSYFYMNPDRGFYCINLSGIRCLPKSKGREHPEIEASVLKKLKNYFQEENEKFYNLSGLVFPWWETKKVMPLIFRFGEIHRLHKFRQTRTGYESIYRNYFCIIRTFPAEKSSVCIRHEN